MKYLIFSDIHGNLEAFKKLLSLKQIKNIDKMLFLGDLVGYGPDPDEVINLFKELKNVYYIRGNHDKVISDLESSSMFNPIAQFSAEWSKSNIGGKNKGFLRKFPKGPMVIDSFITICHGSNFDEDYYVFSPYEALESLKFMTTSIGFFGHTHFPIMYMYRNKKINSVALESNKTIKLDVNTRYLINPGSIGQPRDRNPDPSFIIFDSDKKVIKYYRFKYDYKLTQKKIRENGIPEPLAARLESGI